ncbi:MAG: hypothetical protein R3F54_09235 [Alphaproteobacteria bacterium]
MSHPDLITHAAQTAKDIVELAPGIWTALGHAAANLHLVAGAASVTIIDTMKSTSVAADILAEFGKRTDKPVKRIRAWGRDHA